MSEASETAVDFQSFVFHIPLEKFIYRLDGQWQVHTPVGPRSMRLLLASRGVDADVLDSVFKNDLFQRTVGYDTFPNEGPIVERPAGRYLNVWVPPTLKPADAAGPDDFPRVLRLIEWLAGGDAGAMDWIFHWLTAKIQNPGLLPGTAPVFNTLPGSGKNSLFEVMATILGPENCRVVTRPQLESRFNGFVKSLFVLGDEIKSYEHQKEIAEQLKIFITGTRVELENKGQNSQAVTNRMAWMFASNDRIAPISVDAGDRRYSIFSNFASITPEHREMLRSMRTVGSTHWAPDFEAEIAAFARYALDYPLPVGASSMPYENASRQALVESSKSSSEAFLDEVHAEGIDDLLERMFDSKAGFGLRQSRPKWDAGRRGITKDVFYTCYVAWCDAEGKKPLAKNRLSTAVLNGTPPLTDHRVRLDGRQKWCWIVPRREGFDEEAIYRMA